MEGVEIGEGGVEEGERGGVGEFDGGDQDGVCAEGAQVLGQGGTLLRRAGDKDARCGGAHCFSLDFFGCR